VFHLPLDTAVQVLFTAGTHSGQFVRNTAVHAGGDELQRPWTKHVRLTNRKDVLTSDLLHVQDGHACIHGRRQCWPHGAMTLRGLQFLTLLHTLVVIRLWFMETEGHNSTVHLRWRIDARDAKLNCREEQLARHRPTRLRVCKCNICRGETKSLRKSAVVVEHLTRYGRAPFLRGSTKVRILITEMSRGEPCI
jgi:hypothetical protein